MMIPSLYKLFGVSCPSVKKLLLWRQGDEDERWAEKAIESLIKKLRNKADSVDLLERVLSTQNPQSPCITIPRSLDGRLQVLHRKGLPHVIYCRIFRWPDLQSQHEIRSLDHCKFPFSKSLQAVCINPYHYERIEASVPPPVLVPRVPEVYISSISAMNQQMMHNNGNQMQDPMVSYIQMGNMDHMVPQEAMQKPSFTPVPFLVEKNWCAVSYFELTNQVGEVYRPMSNCVVIDGYANPLTTKGRISLGALSNVRRVKESDAVLGHIGAGIQIFNNLGDVFLENMSSASVFVQSSNLNFMKNFNSKAVVRVSAGNSIQLFYANSFANLLTSRVPMGFYAVNDLTKHCDIYISFIKGWGSGYSRQDLTMCPCWLSIRLMNPLSWLDRVMITMGAPKDPISSYT